MTDLSTLTVTLVFEKKRAFRLVLINLKTKEKIVKLTEENNKIRTFIEKEIELTLIDRLRERAIQFLYDQTSTYEEAANIAYQSHFSNRTTKTGVQARGKFLNVTDFNNSLAEIDTLTEVIFLETPKPPKGLSYKQILLVSTAKQATDFLSAKPPTKSTSKNKPAKNFNTVKPTPKQKKSNKRRNQSPEKKAWPKSQKRSPVKRRSPQKQTTASSKKRRRN